MARQKRRYLFCIKIPTRACLRGDAVQAMFSGINSTPKKFDEENAILIPLAVADTRTALAYVRKHADELGVKKNKIGVVGFSAGGTMAESTAFDI